MMLRARTGPAARLLGAAALGAAAAFGAVISTAWMPRGAAPERALPEAAAGVPLVDPAGVPYRWDLDTGQPNVVGGKVTFYVDPRGTADGITGPKTPANAVRDGIAAWEVSTTRIRFQEDASRTATGRSGTDRVNWIGWVSGGLSPLTFAVTFPTRDGSTVLDMDVVLNDASFAWDTRTPGSPGVADIQSLVTHEWGHAIACDHVPLRASTMYFSADAGAIHLRSLAPDDVALAGSIYPNAAFDATTATLRGRIALSGVSDARSVHVIAVSPATGEPAASALTAPDGSWEIRGLPRGSYRVLCAPTLPLGDAMNLYWRSGRTNFLPAVLPDVDPSAVANPVVARTVRLDDQDDVTVPDLFAGVVASPLEPNDSPASATLLPPGGAACGRFESVTDDDWYALDLVAGVPVTIAALAYSLGSDANPSLQLRDPSGTVAGDVTDIRPSATFSTQPDGTDRDARIVGFVPNATGRWTVRVRGESGATGTNAWYVILATPVSDAPSAQLTTMTASPDRLDAGTSQTSLLAIVPRREDGELVGAGATVQIAHDGGGFASPVADQMNGTYTATVTAASAPGRDRFSVTVQTARGTATKQDAAEIVHVGPVSTTASLLAASPRRAAADGQDVITLTYVPRDAASERLGPGRSVQFSFAPTGGWTATAPADDGEGGYVTEVAATDALALVASGRVPPAEGGPSRTVKFGFGIADVVADAQADVAQMLAVPDLARGVVRRLQQAAGALDAAAAHAVGEGEDVGARKRALRKAKSAARKIAAASEKAAGALSDPGAANDLARSIEQAALAAKSDAVIETGRDQRRFDDATARIDAARADYEADDLPAAASGWFRAFELLAPLL
ncbi:MAG: hypothetical protein HMLKMBBP_03783 [Planctomycetes bacterium]|nr:hypothetical protein [Planctomycetota bacterium]